jgi:DHA1 family tetracycline resistance protein-like MFS transporter
MKDKRLLIIFLTVFIDLVGFGIIIPLTPYLAKNFGAKPFQVGILMGVYSLMQFLSAPFWGQLSDRIGRRPVILWSLLGASFAHAAFGFAGSFWGLIAARGLAGLFGGNISTAMAYVADITPEKDRSRGMGLVGAAFGLGFTLGPFIGGVFADLGRRLGALPPFGESFPSLVAAVICLFNFFLATWRLPESKDFSAPLVIRESRWRRMTSALTTPLLGSLILLVFLNTLAMAHIEASLFLYVRDQFHWTLTQSAYGFAYIGVIMIFTQGYLIRRWIPKFGERRLVLGGFVLSSAAFALIPFAHSLELLAFAVTLLALGNGLTNPALSGCVSLASGREVQGHNLGVAQSLSSLARILGPPTGGALYQLIGAWSPFAAAAALAGLAGTLAWLIRARIPQRTLEG